MCFPFPSVDRALESEIAKVSGTRSGETCWVPKSCPIFYPSCGVKQRWTNPAVPLKFPGSLLQRRPEESGLGGAAWAWESAFKQAPLETQVLGGQ